MNDAHLHLLLNHIPIFACAFGTLALAWALLRNSSDMTWASVFLFLLGAVAGYVASETGESAEEIVEKLPGVTEALIHNHEEAAEFANAIGAVLAACALGILAAIRFRPAWVKKIQGLTLLVALVGNATLARTAMLGGEIRHTEIRSDAPPSPAESESHEDQD